MKKTTTTLLALVAMAGASQGSLILLSDMDNANVGAGAGNDVSSTPFTVGNSLGANGTAENVIDGGATTSDHVTSGGPGATASHGESLTFDTGGTGSNRAVQYGNNYNIGTGDFTLTTWFNTSSTNTQFLFAKDNATSSAEGYGAFIESGSLIVRLGTSGGAANRASQSISLGATYTNTWIHMALVVDQTAGTVTGYLNGSNTGFTNGGGGPTGNTFTASDITTTGDLRLGINGGGGAEFRGNIDDFRIYDTALTSSEVVASMTAVPEPSSAVLLGLFGLALMLRRRK